jgi:MFS family permease
VVVAYVLTDAACLLPAGRLADRVGPAAVFRAGLATTVVALLGCGLAPSFGWLLAARVAQGVGAALVLGSAAALVTLASPAAARQRALGWYNLAFGLGAAIGPLVGGALVAAVGWRAVYMVRAPVAALVLAAAAWRGLPRGPKPGPPAPTPAAPVAADRPAFVRANASNLVASAAHFFVWLLVPFYLVERRALPAETAGLLFGVSSLAAAVAAPLGARSAEAWGARPVVGLALGLEAAGLALASRLDPASSGAEIAVALALAGGGMGLFTTPNMHYVMAALPASRQGWAGSLVVLMRMLGIVLGALAATLADARLAFRGALLVAAGLAGGALVLGLWRPRRRAAPGVGPPPTLDGAGRGR